MNSESSNIINEKIVDKTINTSISFLLLPLIFLMVKYSKNESQIKNKLRYFNPIIKEHWFWGKRVIWVGRNKPLTKQEVNELYKNLPFKI